MKKSRYLSFLFLSFTLAQLISIFGDRLNQFAVIGMIGRVKPGSSTELLKLALFTHLPILFFAPLFGILLDKWKKPYVMILSDLFRGALVLALPSIFLATNSLYAFYIPIVFLSLANLFFAPAKSAIVPEIVDRSELLEANAILWGVGIVSSILGFTIGGWLLDYISWEWGFYTDGLSYLASVLLLLPLIFMLKGDKGVKQPLEKKVGRVRPIICIPVADIVQSIKDCSLLLRKSRVVGAALLMQTLFFGVVGILYVIAIAHIQVISSGERTIYLAAVAASGTAGLLLGSIISTRRINLSSIHAISFAIIVIGISIVGIAKSRTIISLSIWGCTLGAASSPIIIFTETLLQKHIPEKFRGRIFSTREVLTKTTFLVLAMLATLLNSFVSKQVILISLGLFLALMGMLLERKKYLQVDISIE